MKKIIISLISAFIAFQTFGQGAVEALRFSQVYHSGTARFSAMGGAFAALGGDASSLAFNPAGLGVYRSSEFTFTSHLLRTNDATTYMGNRMDDTKFKFGLSNIAGIGVWDMHNNDGLRYLNFGFAYNKTNHFSEQSALRGNPISANGLTEYFAVKANTDWGVESALAWEGYAIDYDSITDLYMSPLSIGDKTYNSKRSTISGDMGEYDFSMGGNIADVVYLGITLGVVSVNYNQTATLSETIAEGDFSDFEKLDYTWHYDMSGIGYNFKFGVIATPFINADILTGLRIAAAVHTPTFLSMTDRSVANINTIRKSYTEPAETPPNEFGYAIETPVKYITGLAYAFNGEGAWRGIVSVDYEYLDYSEIKMRERNNYQNEEIFEINNDITLDYKSASNVRVGGELGYDKFSFRAGYARYDNPYSNSVDKNGAVQILSAGFGIRIGESTNLDFAYTRAMRNDKNYLYNDGYENRSDIANYKVAQNNFLLTLGWRF